MRMKDKHTPGPWMANEEGRIFAGQIDIERD